MMTDVNTPDRVPYRQLQAEETKRRIASAARQLFAERGYVSTSVAAVAGAAGVAVRTVYAAFGTKQAILAAICDSWLQEAEVFPLMAQARSDPNPEHRLALIARINRQQWERGSDVVTLLEAAAAADRDVATMLDGWKSGRADAQAAVVADIADRLVAGLDIETACAILRALSTPEIYRELVDGAGWSPDRYEHWLSGLLARELLGILTADQETARLS
jgi:AcrR family transcriptional regulator